MTERMIPRSELGRIKRQYLKDLGFVPDWWNFAKDKMPTTLNGYEMLRSVVYSDGALSRKTKQLQLVAMNMIARNERGVKLHVRIALRFGARPDELAETFATAVMLGAALPMSLLAQTMKETPELGKAGARSRKGRRHD